MAIPSQFFNKNDDFSSHDYGAMIRGNVTVRDHHFYDWMKTPKGEEDLKKSMGANIPKHDDGKRIPMNKQTKNPPLAPPTVSAQQFFGQVPIIKVAMDQLFAKKIGVFGDETGGSGSGGFNIQSMFSMMGGGANGGLVQKLKDIVGGFSMGSGGVGMSESHAMFDAMKDMATSVGSLIGADLDLEIDLSKPDELAKIMQGTAQIFSGGEQMFDESVFTDGALYAQDVTKHIQKYYGSVQSYYSETA